MKNIFKTVAAFAAVVLAGCTTDFNDEIIAPEGGKTSVTIGLTDTRTSLGDLVEGKRKVYWSEGDQIAINGVTSEAAKIDEVNAGVATFDFEGVLNHPYSVLYPAEMYKDGATVTLPATQAYTQGSFAVDAAPMAGYTASAGEGIVLHHLAAVVRLQVKQAAENADIHDINRIEFRGNNGEQVSGDFTIDYAAATLTSASTADADKVVKATFNGSLNENATEFFVVVPAREYAQGFTVRVLDNAGHYMELSTPAVTLAKGEIKAMPEFEFKPTGTSVDTEITVASAAEWNAFVQKYNAGEYIGKIVSVKITADLVFDDDTNAAFKTLGDSEHVGDFKGQIDGGNFAFKNLKANDALIHQISSTVLKNIVIDSTSSFTFSNIEFDDALYASARCLNTFSSTVTGCVNKANVTVDGCTSEHSGPEMHLGGLIARTDANSVISGCENFGKVETTSTNHTKLAAQIGEMRHGGIVGYNRGKVENCTNEGQIVSAFNCGRKGVGGIVGRGTGTSTLNNCINKGTLSDSSIRIYENVNDHNRWIHVGGIEGFAANPISNCTNEGAINTTTNVKILHIGGIVGRINGENSVVLTKNSNTGAIHHNGQTRQTFVGGIVGSTDGKQLPALDLEGCTIGGSILIEGLEQSAAQTMVSAGSVIGIDNSTSTTVVSNATSTCSITLANIKDVSQYKAGYLGGIIGSAYAANISNCTQNADVAVTVNRSKKGSSNILHIGGVAGAIFSGDSSITNCHATKLVKTWNYTVVDFYTDAAGVTYTPNVTAGILGSYGYDKSYDTIGNITINDCTFSGDLVNYRGHGAGIAGYVLNGTVSNCNVTGNLYADSAYGYTFAGGIVSAAENSTITDCWCKSKIHSKSTSAHAGGIAAFLVYKASVKNCAYYGDLSAETTNYGGVVGRVINSADATVTIENCKFGGTVGGTAITADNVASKAVGLGTATVTGTALWDGTVAE